MPYRDGAREFEGDELCDLTIGEVAENLNIDGTLKNPLKTQFKGDDAMEKVAPELFDPTDYETEQAKKAQK